MAETQPELKPSEKERTEFKSSLLLTDEDVLKLGLDPEDVELYRRFYYTKSYGISSWYDNLSEHTFKTNFLELTYEEADAIIDRNDKIDNRQAILDTLEEKVAKELLKFPNGAFFKLNTRSPKDVPVYDAANVQTQQLIDTEFKKIPKDKYNDNEEVWAFVKATNKALKVTKASEVMDLLLRSTRVREDLSRVLNFGKDLFEGSLIFREWLDVMIEYPEMEFRAFVNDKKLNAMTQYFCFARSQLLVDIKDKVEKAVLTFFDDIKDKLPHPSYVIDFFVNPETLRVMVIELNPFHIGAGTGLFTWREDRETFLNGPFQFRITTEVPKDVKEIIPIKWAKWIKKTYHPEPENSVEEEPERRCSTM